MGLFKVRFVTLVLTIMWCSCSKKALTGSYLYQKGTGRMGSLFTGKRLVINKDSTFIYNESFHEDQADDVGGPTWYYTGQGKYAIKDKRLILDFEPKFRKIGEIKIDSLSQNEIAAFEKKDAFLNRRPENSVLIAFDISFYDFPFHGLSAESDIGTIKIGEQSIHHLRNNTLIYPVSKFPLTLTVDFSKFNMQQTGSEYTEPYWAYQYADEYGFLNFNFGFVDEKIRIEKPGNYKITIYPFKTGYLVKQDQVFTGERILLVKRFLGSVKIGEMKNVKVLPKTE